ncbi:DUF1761 domain-containing protein [Candidatus Gottesmanbacteria bacterium]|nr:DUF1761 domain-containing protein [Candidatus Gottesmanbacteria bacterium]
MPEPVTLNYLAILVSAIASMAVGFLWYSPLLFAKPWMALKGLTEEKLEAAKKQMGQMYALSFGGAIVMAYVLAHFADYAVAVDWVTGAQVGFWAWLGFVAPVQMAEVLFGGKSWKLYMINTGYQLASLLVMGGILGGWR